MKRPTVRHITLFFSLFLTIVVAISARPLYSAPANFQNETLITNLNQPTVMAFTPDGRMLILERSGAIKVVQPGASQPDPTPFMQLTNIVSDQERGALGLALDPNFATNGYFYVFYSASSPFRNRVSRFTANGNQADLSSEVMLWQDIVTPAIWHQGGTVAFGPDGKLYISVGDNLTSSNSPLLTSYSGKILRINSDGTIPTDNPFYDGVGSNLDAIWARGLRNPFRFSWDLGIGKMYIGDVGENSIEEVNVGIAGANYGWPTCEGPCGTSGMTNPIYSYPHNGSASVTGGFVYRGAQFPSSYIGTYFFADYANNWIKQITFNANGTVNSVNNFEPLNGSSFGPYGQIVDLKQGPDGALYYVDIGLANDGSINPGSIRRIRYTAANQPPSAVASSIPSSGPAPLSVNFSSTGSTDPEGQPLTYSWTFGDGQTSTLANPTHVYSADGTYLARLSVSDGVNTTLSNQLSIAVGNPPVATITSPANGATYKAGDTIYYSGTATDPEDGTLAPSAYTWTVVFHHDTHVHPVLGPVTGTTSGSFVIPSTGHPAAGNTNYEILLTATDSSGNQNTKSVFVYPQMVNLSFATAPSGLNITIDGIGNTTPFTYSTLANFQHTVDAPNQSLGASTYQFNSWSDGGTQSHILTVPDTAQTYTATYDLVATPGVSDDFNRSTLGSNWTVVNGSPALTQNSVTGNSTGENLAMWSANQFSSDQFSEIQIASLGDTNHEVQVNVRIQPNTDRYGLYVTSGNNPVVYKRSPYIELGSVPVTVVAGDLLRLEAEGSTLRVKKNGVLAATFTDTTFTSGAPGFNLWNGSTPNSTNRIDSWFGGNIGGTQDTTAPTVALTAPASGETVSGVIAVTASASDNTGVSGVQFKLDGVNLKAELTSSPYTISWDTVGASNGVHTLVAVARDAAGNSATSTPISITVSNQADTTAPVITNVASSNITSNSAVIGWNTDEFADSQVEYGQTVSYGLSSPLNSAMLLAHSQTLSGLVSGTLYHYRVKSRDAAGNLATSPDTTFTTVASDTSNPSVTLTSPAASSTVSGSISVSANASDNVGVIGVQFKLDGANLGLEDTVSPYSIVWNTASTTNGTHSLSAVARDAAGNTGTAGTILVIVANTGPIGPQPVASYKFQENTGTVTADGSGNGSTGTLTNGPTWTTAGKFGNAISFDGTNDFVNVADKNSLDIGNTGTIEAWIKPAKINRWNSVIAKGSANSDAAHNYALEITNGNKFVCILGNGSTSKTVTSTASAVLNQFAHVACVWTGTSLQLYINGVLNTSTSQGITPAGNTSPLMIGRFGGNTDNFQGVIDEVRIYNQALTQTQVQSDMNTAL